MKRLIPARISLWILFATFAVTARAQLPTNFPAITVTAHDPDKVAPGYLFLASWTQTPGVGSYVMILDNDGNPVHGDKFKELLTVAGDFKMQPNGLLSHAESIGTLTYTGGWDVKHQILDDALNVTDTFQMGNGYLAEFHDFQWLPNGHALLVGYYLSEVDVSRFVAGGHPAALVSGGILQELDADRNVVWQWRSWDHFEFEDVVTSRNAVISEFHFNDLVLDRDGNIIVGTPSEIRKINRQTGEVMWTLGGPANEFTFVGEGIDADDFGGHGTHRLANGNFLAYDNGSTTETSRAIEFSLDEVGKVATLVWSYAPETPIQGRATRYAQRLDNGNTLICWGIPRTASVPICTEVTPAGEKVFELTFDDPLLQSYRAFRFVYPASEQKIQAQESELAAGNSYSFGDTGVGMEVTAGGGGYNEVTVTRQRLAPLYSSFVGKAPRVLSERVIVEQTGIPTITATISFDAPTFGFENPADLTVYFRPTPGSGLFVALPTAAYNPVTQKVRATMNQFGEFIFGYPDVADLALPPILHRPESYRGVQTNMVIAPRKAESNEVYRVNHELPIYLSWSPRGFARYYELQVALNPDFSDPVIDLAFQTEAYHVWSNAAPGSIYYWRVRTLVENNGLYEPGEWSSGNFQTVPPQIEVTWPNGRELVQRGLSYFVQWQDNIAGPVTIHLYKGGAWVGNIATNIPSTGAYEWDVDLALEPGADYSIQVTSVDDPGLSDASDAVFYIDVPVITSITPLAEGGVVLEWGGTTGDVYIEFSPSLAPPSWTEIAGPLAGQPWTNTSLPNVDSGNFRLLVK